MVQHAAPQHVNYTTKPRHMHLPWAGFPSAISFFRKQFKPIGACSGDSSTSLFLPGHFIPAALFNEFSSFPSPATQSLKFFQFLFMVRLLHKLGDANR